MNTFDILNEIAGMLESYPTVPDRLKDDHIAHILDIVNHAIALEEGNGEVEK